MPAQTVRSVAAGGCSNYWVPLVYQGESGSWNTTLSINVCKVAGPSGATRQIWLVPGGPGEVRKFPANNRFEIFIDLTHRQTAKVLSAIVSAAATDYNADIYTAEFRGVGENFPVIACKSALANLGITQGSPRSDWHACNAELMENSGLREAEFGKFLRQYSTDNAARDYNTIIQLVNAERAATGARAQEIWLNGYSYGTLLVSRIVSLFPNLATHVVLDGSMFGPEVRTLFSDYDLAGDEVFKQIFEDCAKDSFCQKKIPSASFGADTMKKVAGGSCKAVTDNVPIDQFRTAVRYGVLQSPVAREMLPMLMYRMNRCDAKSDAVFLSSFAKVMAETYKVLIKNPNALSQLPLRNVILGFYIQINENVDLETPVEQLLARFSDSPLGPGLAVTSYRENVYPEFSGRYFNPLLTSLPGNNATTVEAVIFVNGGWDTQTPAKIGNSRFADSFLSVPKRYNLNLPQRGHINSFPGVQQSHPCGPGVVKAFIQGSGSVSAAENFFKYNSDCAKSWFDWNARLLAQTQLGQVLGVTALGSDIWESGAVLAGTPSIAAPAGLEPAILWSIVGGAAALGFLLLVVLVGFLVKRKLNRNKLSDSVDIGRTGADGVPYSPLNDSLLPK